ncbi:MAG TPA: hypothetical protein VHE80_04830 [Acidimicrobiales bacterium]|nr:hypothetical protein [Acidimicrobiales bacterium]
MPSSLHATRRFPFLADFSAKDRALAQRASKALAGRQRKADEARGAKATDGTSPKELRRLGADVQAQLDEVLVDARSNVGTHDLRTENEWGWSHHWTNQNNYLTMNVLHPNTPEPSLALMSNFYLRTDDDTNKHVENLTSGQHYYAVLTTAQPVPAGQSVVVEVGTRTVDITRANDVAVHSRTDFQWSISSVEVRIAP